jgi:LacI family transcriptional regulator
MAVNGRPNLRQIAAQLGLSVTTVSRALKDGPEVHPDTIARVKQAASAAGYMPNLHGRALRTGQTRALTAILPLETRDYLSDLAKLPLIEGMTLAAQERGYSLSVNSATPDEDPQENLDRVIQLGGADGLVITRMVADDPRVPFLLERKIPFAAFGRSGSAQPYAFVDIDNERIAHEAAVMLLEAGCERIALQLLTLEDQYSAARMQGYRAAMAASGRSIEPGLIGHEDFTMAASEDWFGRLLDGESRPDGVICANELGLLGVLSAMRQRGLVPGEDVHIVVRDNTRMVRYLGVPLIAHAVDMSLAGRKLIEALLDRIESPDTPPQQVMLTGAVERLT